jgi:Rieske Fe-S protein
MPDASGSDEPRRGVLKVLACAAGAGFACALAAPAVVLVTAPARRPTGRRGIVDVASGGSGFACPCHTSAFDGDGHRTGGPAPRGMDPLETRVEDGFVLVDFRRYRMSVPERVEVG